MDDQYNTVADQVNADAIMNAIVGKSPKRKQTLLWQEACFLAKKLGLDPDAGPVPAQSDAEPIINLINRVVANLDPGHSLTNQLRVVEVLLPQLQELREAAQFTIALSWYLAGKGWLAEFIAEIGDEVGDTPTSGT